MAPSDSRASRTILPPRLRPGDTVAIISPASPVKPEYIAGLCKALERMRLIPMVMPAAEGPPFGTYAASPERRIADFSEAWRNPAVKAIICSRGGYGSVEILHHLGPEGAMALREHPKWLVGFSDISALHAMLNEAGIVSLHAPMAKDITRAFAADQLPEDVSRLLSILLDGRMDPYILPPNPFSRPGECSGILTGGNLATINGLAGTPFDPLTPEKAAGKILFMEDVGENVYEINRMLFRLCMSGTLQCLAGIIVGQFTDYREDRTYATMERMIDTKLRDWNINCPVIFGFPAGHVDINMPLPLGAPFRMTVSTDGATLAMCD